MSTVSSLILKRPILPFIQIIKNDASILTLDPFTPTFDFRLRKLIITPAFDAIGGKFEMTITSSDAANAGANTILNNVDEGNEILFQIGKTNANKKKIIRGMIESWEINEQNKNIMELTAKGPDWGSFILKNRIVNQQWVQKRNSDGSLDATDTATTIQQIVLDLLQKRSTYPSNDISVEDQGVVVNSANIAPIDFKLAVFNANYEFLDDKLQELDDLGGAIHYVDPDKNFRMKQLFPSSTNLLSDILLVDDNNDSVGLGWDATKIGLVEPNSTTLRTLEHHKRRVYGLGGENEKKDQNSETTTGNTQLDVKYIAQKFTPDFISLTKIVVWISKVGTPPDPLTLDVREDNNGLPTGETLRSITKPASIAGAIGAGATISVFEINEELNSTNPHWIVLHKNGNSTNTFRWHHDNTDNNPATSATSSDDQTWNLTATPDRFKYSFQTWFGTPVLHVMTKDILTATKKHFAEDVIRKSDITSQEVMRALLRRSGDTLFKKKEIIKCSVYAPDILLETGQSIRIRKQTSGYVVDNNYVIGNIEYIFEGTDDGSPGPIRYNIEAARYVDYP